MGAEGGGREDEVGAEGWGVKKRWVQCRGIKNILVLKQFGLNSTHVHKGI